MRPSALFLLGSLVIGLGVGCGDGPGTDAGAELDAPRGGDAPGLDVPGLDVPGLDVPGLDAPGLDAPAVDVPGLDASGVDAGLADDAPSADGGSSGGPIDAARDRLLGTYLDHLRARPDERQTNGLRGSELTGVCDLWTRLQPSAQAVFLTITARMGGATLGSDGSLMLDHVTILYRVVGGEGATATDPGACGGAGNRMFMSMDPLLATALIRANANRGARGPTGVYDLADVVPSSFWRDARDLAGPHAPFTMSDETDGGAPRGQIHFFVDPLSAPATSPLGVPDLAALVDPLAFEIDQDYDCVHASNPLCDYTFYGAACFPLPRMAGVDIYADNYGPIDLTWLPAGC